MVGSSSSSAPTARGAATRRRVLDATAELLAHEGYAAVTWRRVASAAGVTGGVLQHHFGDRRQLLREVFTQFSADLAAHLAASTVPADLAPAARVDAFLEVLGAYLTPERELMSLQLTLALGQEDQLVPGAVLLAALEQQEAHWAALFPTADRTTVRRTFRLLHATLQGMAVHRLLVGQVDEPEARAMLARMLAAELARA